MLNACLKDLEKPEVMSRGLVPYEIISLPQSDELLPEIRMPLLTIIGSASNGDPRKIFIFTEQLIGLGRSKPNQDPRVHIVTRLLPYLGLEYINWDVNLPNISQFHAQLRWQLGRVEIHDENSDKELY